MKIEKETYNVFMRMNVAKHKTNYNQETKLREEKNRTIEEHSIKPQH